MILKIVLVVVGVLILLLGALYLMLFGNKAKARKKPHIDPEFERLRAKNYPPPFPNGWFSLCSSDEIKKGEVKEIAAFGQKLAVFRGHDGKVGGVDVFCPHLGANLSDGCVKDNHLVCPFHAWEFNRSGECQHIPYSENGHQNNKVKAKAWTVKENWGMVLAWYHSDNEPPSWETDGYLNELKDYKYRGKTSEVLNIHLQDFSENGADYAHFNVVHDLLAIPFANKFVHIKHTTNIEFGEGNEKHLAWFTDRADIARNKDNTIVEGAGGGAEVTYYGPGFLVFNFKTRLGDPIILKTFTPLGELKVRMDDHVYAPKGSFPLAIKYVVEEATMQFHDDINIWERKEFATNPGLVKGDGPIMKMRKWYSQFYTESSYGQKAVAASGSNGSPVAQKERVPVD